MDSSWDTHIAPTTHLGLQNTCSFPVSDGPTKSNKWGLGRESSDFRWFCQWTHCQIVNPMFHHFPLYIVAGYSL